MAYTNFNRLSKFEELLTKRRRLPPPTTSKLWRLSFAPGVTESSSHCFLVNRKIKAISRKLGDRSPMRAIFPAVDDAEAARLAVAAIRDNHDPTS